MFYWMTVQKLSFEAGTQYELHILFLQNPEQIQAIIQGHKSRTFTVLDSASDSSAPGPHIHLNGRLTENKIKLKVKVEPRITLSTQQAVDRHHPNQVCLHTEALASQSEKKKDQTPARSL